MICGRCLYLHCVHHFITSLTTPVSLTFNVYHLLMMVTQTVHWNVIHSQQTPHLHQLPPLIAGWNVEVPPQVIQTV